jgi:hypothetical protein
MRMPRTSITLLAGVALLVPVACGGDDAGSGDAGGGDGGAVALSDEAFCERIEQLEAEVDELTQDEAEARFLEDIRALRSVAPNDEVRSALETFEEFFEQVASIDETDPEALEEIFELAASPRFVEAEATLERYSVETCGFEPDDE